MKVHEIVNESISVSDQTWKVRRIISSHLIRLMKGVAAEILPDIKIGIIADENTMITRIKWYLNNNMDYCSVLSKEFKEQGLRAAYTTHMENPNVGGQADKDVIWINEAFDKKIIEYIVQDFTNPVFDYENIKRFLDNYELSNTVKSIISKISSVFIHELVHIIQNKNQQHRIIQNYPIEYRSYLEKDKKKVVRAAYDQLSKMDREIYLATIQEIPAFAHQRAIDIMDIISHNMDIDDMDKYELMAAMTNLDEFFEYEEWKNMANQAEYKQFNTPKEENRYKVFKRYMKILYQELMDFKDRLYLRYKEIRNESI